MLQQRACLRSKPRSTEEALDAVVQSPDTEQAKSHKDGDGGDKTAAKRKADVEDTTRTRAYNRGKFSLSQSEQQQHMFNLTQAQARKMFKKREKKEE